MCTELFDKSMLLFPLNYQGEMIVELLNMFAGKDNYLSEEIRNLSV